MDVAKTTQMNEMNQSNTMGPSQKGSSAKGKEVMIDSEYEIKERNEPEDSMPSLETIGLETRDEPIEMIRDYLAIDLARDNGHLLIPNTWNTQV
ncbi:UNVERIFIED_CONTAM: hypothetical protein Sradi_0685100 [Sesamum radiatum]|uniref:Uncharacterized protein n=1 Tax=Sesamum radiatum TaxID=300843 RepID=A0AAW2VQ72_SESRA